MNRTGIFSLILGVVALGAGIGYSLSGFNDKPGGSPPSVELLLKQQYPDATGEMVDLNAYRGQVLVLNFWASWCAPCIEEMPDLSRLYAEMAGRGVQFLGLGIDNAANIRRFANSKVTVLYPLLVLDGAGIEMARHFGNKQGGLPYTVVIDRAGRIAERMVGRVNIDSLRAAILGQLPE